MGEEGPSLGRDDKIGEKKAPEKFPQGRYKVYVLVPVKQRRITM